MKKSLPAGGHSQQLKRGGRNSHYDHNWRNKADITSFYFTHFPEEVNEELLWWNFKKWGDVREVYIARRLNKEGRRYGFVRFKNVLDAKGLELRLDNIVINECKLFVNLPRFDRPGHRNELKESVPVGRKKIIEGSNIGVTHTGPSRKSYAEAIKGGCQGETKGDEVRRPVIQINLEGEGGSWCEGTWLGKLKKMTEVETLEDRIAWELGYNVETKFLGDDMVLLPGLPDDKAQLIIQSEMDRGDSLFYELKKWSPAIVPNNRVVWLQIWGYPIQVWEMEYFRRVVADIGDVIQSDDDTEDRRRLDRVRLMVRTPLPPPIRSEVTVRVGELEHKVWIVEEVGPDSGLTKRRSAPSEGWSEMVTSDDERELCDAVDDTDSDFSFSSELSNRNSSPVDNQWVQCRTDGYRSDGGPMGNNHINVTQQEKSKSTEGAMLVSNSGTDNTGDRVAVTQKDEVYTKKEPGQSSLQNDYRHSYHSQGINLNGEEKADHRQACIGEEGKCVSRTYSPELQKKGGPVFLKGPLEAQGGCGSESLKGPIVVHGGCDKENGYPDAISGLNECHNQNRGGLSQSLGPLMSAEGGNKENFGPTTHISKENSEKFSRVYSRQRNGSHLKARTSHLEAQSSSPERCNPSPADQNDSQIKAQNQTHLNSDRRLKSVIQGSDETLLEAQHLWSLGKDLGMETDSDTLNFVHSYASMECRDRAEAKVLGNWTSPQ